MTEQTFQTFKPKPELVNSTHTSIYDKLQEFTDSMWETFSRAEHAGDGRCPVFFEHDNVILIVTDQSIEISYTYDVVFYVYVRWFEDYDTALHFVWEFLRVEDLTNINRLSKLFGFERHKL
jgi:hypothetical protein